VNDDSLVNNSYAPTTTTIITVNATKKIIITMRIHFWGTRGSIATPLTNAELFAKLEATLQMAIKAGLNSDWQVSAFIKNLPWHLGHTIGGNTTSIEVDTGEKLLILDAGTGIRPLGYDLVRRYCGNPFEAHILLSHTHWDHICGIPFFTPAYNPDNNITIYGAHNDLKARIENQQDSYYFPIPLSYMKGIKEFIQLEERGSFIIGDVTIETMPLNHPGGCFAYRIKHGDKTMVFATDSEYNNISIESMKPYINFFHNADLLIFDAQYTMLENVEKENWGHSNTFTGVDMAIRTKVKRLAFVHHEPAYNDKKLWTILEKTRKYLDIHPSKRDIQLYLAHEGLSLTI